MSTFKLPRTLSASIAGLSLAFTGLGLAPTTAQAQDPLDEVERQLSHFNCHQVLEPAPNFAIAFLQDQFDRLSTPAQTDIAFIFGAVQFCNPAEKQVNVPGGVDVTPLVNPFNHLTFYFMLDFPPEPNLTVAITNQFGPRQAMTVFPWAFFLGVPTQKNTEPPPDELDHFKCYFVQGEPVNRTVRLFDQFQPNGVDAQVGAPQLLCNPTRKTPLVGEPAGILEPQAHLLCYATETSTPPNFTRDVFVTNQFQNNALHLVGRPNSLCVPSLKQIVGIPLPDLVIELPSAPVVTCSAPPVTCVHTQDYRVSEIAGVPVTTPFEVEIVNDEGQSATAVITSLGAGASTGGVLTLGPPGGNCYNGDCTTDAKVDTTDAVTESDESNNTTSRFDLG